MALTNSTDRAADSAINVQISNLIVRTLSDHTGRGPTRARTHISEDVITVVLSDTLTKSERSLIEAGEHDVVRATRRAHHRAMTAEVVTAVEQISGRKVLAFLGDDHFAPDVVVKSLVLEPLED